jgi:hypothetical protein
MIAIVQRTVPLLIVALLLAPPAAAGIAGGPHDVQVGETRAIDIDFWNQQNQPVSTLLTRVPENAVLVTATASDPAWIARRSGRDLEWQGGRLPLGAHLHVRLVLRFPEAGRVAPLARMSYVGGAYEEAPIFVDVHGTASQTDILIVFVAGAAIFLGAILVFVFGRRALRG